MYIFKVGDRVCVNKASDSDTYKVVGKTGTINHINNGYAEVVFDNFTEGWEGKKNHWNVPLIDLILIKKPTKDELFDMPIGTKITTNAEADNVFFKIRDKTFENINEDLLYDVDIEADLSINDTTFGTKILKIEVPTYGTCYDSITETKEMTMEEICQALGYNVKIIKTNKEEN